MKINYANSCYFPLISYKPNIIYYYIFLKQIEKYKKNELSSNEVYDITIVGGGLFSCCLYYFLKKKNPLLKILIIEKEKMLGGYVKTYKNNKKFLFELGPNIFKLNDDSYNLIKELHLLCNVRVLNKKLIRYIYYNDKLYPLHFNLIGYFIFPLIKISNKVKLILKLFFKKYKNINLYDNDISVENYMKENFDLQHYNFLLLPLIYGSCGGNGDISAISFFSRNLKFCDNNINSLYIWRERKIEKKKRHKLNGTKFCNTYTFHNFFYKMNKDEKLFHYMNILNKYNALNYNKKIPLNSYKKRSLFHINKKKSLNIIKEMCVLIKNAYKNFLFLYKKIIKKSKQEEEKKKFIGKLVSLKYGLYEIISKLNNYINQKYVCTNCEVDFIKRTKENLWMCNIKNEKKNYTIYSKNVVLTVNSKICSNIMRYIISSDIKNILLNFSYSNIISVTLYYNKKDVRIPSNFFGFLSSDKLAHILGCFYINNMFKERCDDNNIVLLTLYMGGQNNPNDIFLKKEEIAEIISEDLKKIFQIENNIKPVILKIKKWYNAIPIYLHNYEKDLRYFLDELNKSAYQNLFIDSGWITGTSISDRITSAKDLSEFIQSKFFSE
ncbi:protoporphyrinogen oxidase, putative [Plasmodium gallinaceum]|uniref:Protoporphyrinogen oxidase n=1 Tax=Plasmodium gallinaceum TaxID=5849 RepID=A0A1J1H1U1_PLAGA|nr:protoporphyrinogen oxidase, putative [Plasmodium gallinaceum]CRG97294.1 protoporphyrinogen oxidase, putative [Plasmodium gallinaceum]